MERLISRLRRVLRASRGAADEADETLGVKERYESSLLALEGVVSVGVGAGTHGNRAIVVGVRDSAARDALTLPRSIEGVDIVSVVLGTPIAAEDDTP